MRSRDRSRSLKMAPFDRSYASYYWSANVGPKYTIPFLSYLTLQNWDKGHWRSLKMVPFESMGKVSCSHSIATKAVSCIVTGCSRSFNRTCRPITFYWSAITGSALALHCCKANAKINRKIENWTPSKIVTHEDFNFKLGTRDYWLRHGYHPPSNFWVESV